MAYDKADRKPMRKGHKKVCSFCVDKVEFIDYKVEVPNTYTKEKSFLTKLLEFLLFVLC